jgi:hypothetical protein
MKGSMPEWLMGADCKSAAKATLVQIRLGPFTICPHSSVVEHFIGNEEVMDSNSIVGFG